MILFPTSHRVLRKVFLCGIVLAFTGVGAGGTTDDEIDSAVNVATLSLQREMTSLKEQLELFEMKHETLQAASEQFRMQSKSAKSKLEAERSRYDVLASEKESLDTSIESKIAIALEDQKITFEDTIAAELIEKRKLLAQENEVLVEKLRRSEYQLSKMEENMKDELEEKTQQYEISAGKRQASEEKLRTEATDLRKRLSYSEKQAKSFEESWKNAVIESEEKDDYFQEESRKRMDEASRWEKRIQKLNTESKDLFAENKAKEIELVRSKKIHMTLLEKLQESDEAVKEHESKIKRFTAEIRKLSKDLKFASSELTQSKRDHASLFDKFEILSNLHQDTEVNLKSVRTENERNTAKNEVLQNELVDVRFDLETSQKKTKKTIEEKSEMTKSYTEALEQLTSKNKFLRYELVDTKYELEQSQNETHALRTETFEITSARKDALDRLESEGNKLKLLQREYTTLNRDFEMITNQFKESEAKLKNFKQRIEEDGTVNEDLQKELLYSKLKLENSQNAEKQLDDKNNELLKMYEEIQKKMESSETKLLETKEQYYKSQDHVEMLQGTVRKLEENVEELIEQLDLKVAKNTYLQKSLLDTKFDLEESQNKVNLLEGQMAEISTNNQNLGTLEIEKNDIIVRAQALELELQKSTSSYNVASRKINDLRDQLNATETRSAQVLNMYELMKEENDALNRNLRTSEEHKKEFHSATLELQDQNESFEQCGKDLHETQAEYSNLMVEYDAAKERIDGAEKKLLSQQEAIKELKKRQSELETVATQREKQLEERPQLLEEIDTVNGNLIDVKPDSSEAKTLSSVEKSKGEKDEVENDAMEEAEKSEASAVEDPVKDTNDSENTTGQNQQETQKQSRESSFSFFRWLDYALYTILRVIVDSIGFLANGLWQAFIARLVIPFKSFFAIASLGFNELRIIHDALVSLFEFEMTFVSSLLSRDRDRTAFLFLINHSEMFVMFGEAIAVMLGIDFIVSSFLNPIRSRKRRPKAKTIHVPKTANASLLRKANNM